MQLSFRIFNDFFIAFRVNTILFWACKTWRHPPIPSPLVLPLTPCTLATLTFGVFELIELFAASGPSCALFQFPGKFFLPVFDWPVLTHDSSHRLFVLFSETFLDFHKNRSLPLSFSHGTCSFPQYDHKV